MRQHPLRFALALALAGVVAMPAAQAQQKPIKQPDAPAASSTTAAAVASKSDDTVDLEDIRNFTRVYQIVRQAYVEKLDNKTIMKAAI
ncbi:MAG: peptidase S41, partial [Luteibacter sp.]